MAANETVSREGLDLRFNPGDFSNVSILADISLHGGTPIEETGWLDGNAGGDYPGSLTGFLASNSDGNALGSLRMVTIQLDTDVGTPVDMVFLNGVSKVVGIIGANNPTADKTISVATFTDGLVTDTSGSESVAGAGAGGSALGITVETETAAATGCTVTLLVLN